MINFHYLEGKVLEWAFETGILAEATALTQACKTLEEVTETIKALVIKDDDAFIDGVGDIQVTLIILAHLKGTSVTECLEVSYNVIKDRTGKMVNGTFVKDGK